MLYSCTHMVTVGVKELLAECLQISPTATSDVLSDKNKFPYFMRMSPPDRYQVLYLNVCLFSLFLNSS